MRDVEHINQLNGPDLLKRASSCLSSGAKLEGNFLLHAAYLRFGVDVMQMIPSSSADAGAVMAHAAFLMYYVDGPDEAEILRDPRSRERYFSLLDRWRPEFGPNYSPGWSVRSRPKAADYQAAMAQAKASRREYLAEVARLVSDDVYYGLYQRRREILARHTDGVIEGPDSDLLAALRLQMNDRAGVLGSPFHSSKAEHHDLSEPKFPPHVPAGDETVTSEGEDPVSRRCSHLAEWQGATTDTRISRVLITRSPQWGTIWRADIKGRDQETTRFTCTSNTSSSMPLEAANPPIPPLPEPAVVPR